MNVGLFQVQIFSRVSLKKVAFSSLALSQADCFRSSTRFQAADIRSSLSQKYSHPVLRTGVLVKNAITVLVAAMNWCAWCAIAGEL